MRAKLRLIGKTLALLLAAICPLGCATGDRQPFELENQQRTLELENEGRVCLYPQEGENLLPGSTLAGRVDFGCFSSSCTTVLEQSSEMQVNLSDFSVHLSAHALVEIPGEGPWACTADCGGVGDITMAAETPLREGTYSVWIDDQRVGEIRVPMCRVTQSNPVCFGVGATMVPLPTPTLERTPTPDGYTQPPPLTPYPTYDPYDCLRLTPVPTMTPPPYPPPMPTPHPGVYP